MKPPPVRVKQGPPTVTPTKAVLLKGKPTKKSSPKSVAGLSVESAPPLSDRHSLSSVQIGPMQKSPFSYEGEEGTEEEEEEEEEDYHDGYYLETGERIQLPEYFSIDDEESSDQTPTKPHRMRIRYNKKQWKKDREKEDVEIEDLKMPIEDEEDESEMLPLGGYRLRGR